MLVLMLCLHHVPFASHVLDESEHDFSPFIAYKKRAIADLRRLLLERDREEHRKILRSHGTLNALPLLNSTQLLPSEEKHVFSNSKQPVIAWQSELSRTSCDTVKYANRSAQYLFRRFKTLRQDALTYLDLMTHTFGPEFTDAVNKYDAILVEIDEVLNLVETAFPPSFYEYDRLATYTFEQSDHVDNRIVDEGLDPFGKVIVSKIKLGTMDWIPVYSGVKDIANFLDEPNISAKDYSVKIQRQLNPLEACLGDLGLSFVGLPEFKEPNCPGSD